jgi:Zn-dependent peptidase ImmA (M78 family)
VAGEWANRGAKRAREARAELRLGGDPPPDLLDAVERAGAHVVLLELDPRVAGAYVPRGPLVVVNGRQPLVRQRFTLAHELGHHRMCHGAVVDGPHAIAGGDGRDPREVAANAFAAELLLPRAAVAAWGERQVRGAVTLEHVVLLAHEHGVSARTARIALARAGVLAGTARERALDGEIAAGMHVRLERWLGLVPRPDGLADAAAALPWIPSALRYTALGDYLAGAIGADGLARGLSADPCAVRAMLRALWLDRLVPG